MGTFFVYNIFDKISDFEQEIITINPMKVDSFAKTNGKSFNFYKFPLKLFYAAHKSPGQTLERCAIYLQTQFQKD